VSLFVLDTDAISQLQRGFTPLIDRVREHSATDELATTIITVEESLTGWQALLRKNNTRDRLAKVYQLMTETVELIACFRVFSFDESAIARYEDLFAQRLNVRKMDLRIAAIALEQNATLVTRNVRDFARVPGLRVENWMD